MNISDCTTSAADHATPDLQRANEFQAALIGMAGHDLRQPLQVIQRTYELLRNRIPGVSEQPGLIVASGRLAGWSRS